MLWFNILLTGLILLFTVATIGEQEMERKKIYQSILMLSIFCFFVMNFFQWAY